MKIAFFTDTYLPNVDGVVTTMVNYRDEMQARGHEVFVFSSGDRKAREANKDKRVFFFPSVRFPPYPQYKIAIFPFSSEDIAAGKKIELVHSHALASMGLAAIKTAKDLKIPLVGTFHTMVPIAAKKMLGKTAERIAWKAVKIFYSQFDVVTSPSKTTQAILADKGVESIVLPNAVDTAKFNPSLDNGVVKNILGAEKIVLVAGRLSQEKNVDVVIKAAGEVLKSTRGQFKTKFVVTGEGPARKQLEALIADEGLEKDFVLTGFLQPDELPLYYAAGDCFATASTFETQGLALLEAMACGKPAVGADAMAIPESIREGENGFLFKPGDAAECAEKIIRVLTAKKSDYARMAKNARATAEQYSIPKSTEKLLQIYDGLLGH